MAIGDIWYRVEDAVETNGYVDEWGDYRSTGSTGYARLCRFWVLRETPKGVWLVMAYTTHNWAANASQWEMPEGMRDAASKGIKAYRESCFGTVPRFVRLDTRKAYARPTIDAAVESFKARKAFQLLILKRKIKNIEAAEYDADLRKFRDG